MNVCCWFVWIVALPPLVWSSLIHSLFHAIHACFCTRFQMGIGGLWNRQINIHVIEISHGTKGNGINARSMSWYSTIYQKVRQLRKDRPHFDIFFVTFLNLLLICQLILLLIRQLSSISEHDMKTCKIITMNEIAYGRDSLSNIVFFSKMAIFRGFVAIFIVDWREKSIFIPQLEIKFERNNE